MVIVLLLLLLLLLVLITQRSSGRGRVRPFAFERRIFSARFFFGRGAEALPAVAGRVFSVFSQRLDEREDPIPLEPLNSVKIL
jgi:hypothetical protein